MQHARYLLKGRSCSFRNLFFCRFCVLPTALSKRTQTTKNGNMCVPRTMTSQHPFGKHGAAETIWSRCVITVGIKCPPDDARHLFIYLTSRVFGLMRRRHNVWQQVEPTICCLPSSAPLHKCAFFVSSNCPQCPFRVWSCLSQSSGACVSARNTVHS